MTRRFISAGQSESNIGDIAERNRLRGFERSLWQRIARKMYTDRVRHGDISVAQQIPPASLNELFDRHGEPLVRPDHWAPLARVIEDSLFTEQRKVVAGPPRHGKTTILLMGLILHCLARPNNTHMFVTYNAERAGDVLRNDMIPMLRKLQIRHDTTNDTLYIMGGSKVPGGSTIRFVSSHGGITGYDATGLCVVDDPIKDASMAASQTQRDGIFNEFTKGILTRSGGRLSVIVSATRWHDDDLSGRLIKRGWDYIRIPAICDDELGDPLGRKLGEPLWHAGGLTLEFLQRQKRDMGDRVFECMFQGNPMPPGERIFLEPARYTAMPSNGVLVSYGIDCAGYATVRKNTDYNVCVKLITHLASGVSYVARVVRMKSDPDPFIAMVKAMVIEQPGPITWFVAGQEEYVAKKMGLPNLHTPRATQSKTIRAIPVSRAWNAGNVQLPLSITDTSMAAFQIEVCSFTGLASMHDDCIDALVGAYHSVTTRLDAPTRNSFVNLDRHHLDRRVQAYIDTRQRL